jgi:hypothetical protein
MNTLIKWIGCLCVIAAIGFKANASHADMIHCDVRAIHATTEDGEFDATLKPLKEKLRKAFDGYSSFRLLQAYPIDLERGAMKSLELPNKRQFTLTYNGLDEDYNRLNLKVDDRLDTDLRLAAGGTFFQAMNHGEGILIIAVTAGTPNDDTAP